MVRAMRVMMATVTFTVVVMAMLVFMAVVMIFVYHSERVILGNTCQLQVLLLINPGDVQDFLLSWNVSLILSLMAE